MKSRNSRSDLKISVIIPVYNAEKYLERCVNSVLESLGRMRGEVILVNNNSTDRSAEIIAEFYKKYPKVVRGLECAPKGGAAARNCGFKAAKGEYVWFIDADDAVSKRAISELVAEADKTGADFVMLGADRILESGKKIYLSAIDPKDPEFKSKFLRRAIGPWQVIVRREWWKESKFQFTEGMIHEDLELMPAIILKTDRIASVDQPFYTYYFIPGSVLHSAKWDPKYLDIFPVLERLYWRFETAGELEKYRDELEWFFIYNLLIDSAGDFKKGGREGLVGFRRTRKMLRSYFPKWRKNRFLNQKKLGLKFKIRVYLSYFGIVF